MRLIVAAMRRLAELGSASDAAEGPMLRAMAERFAAALEQSGARSFRAGGEERGVGQTRGEALERARRVDRLRRACAALVVPVIPSPMKTAISLPDDVFREIEACAKRLKLSRSGLVVAATREFLARHRDAASATDAWDRAIASAGQPGDDPAAAAFRRRTKATVRGGPRW